MKPGFLHTAQSHIQLFDEVLLSVGGPDALHQVDESLLSDAIAGESPDILRQRALKLLEELAAQGCQSIACTCSTLGSLLEDETAGGLVVQRIDRAAADALMNYDRVLVLCALESAAQAADTLLEESKVLLASQTEWVITLVPNAWDKFQADDQQGYFEAIGEFANGISDGFDAVFLAQASMMGAKKLCSHHQVFTSVETCVQRLIQG